MGSEILPLTFGINSILYLFTKSLGAGLFITEVVKNKYFNSRKPVTLQYIDLITDLYFVNGVYCTVKKQAAFSNTPIYLYEFFFDGKGNAFKQLFKAGDYAGTSHADEIPYLFKFDALNITIENGSAEHTTSSRLVKLWTNFAKIGNPTPHPDPMLQNVLWRPVSKTYFPYLGIDGKLEMGDNLNFGRPVWWEFLIQTFFPAASFCSLGQ